MRPFKGLVATLVLGVVIAIGLLGCNTFRGAGQDIQKGGRAVEDAADGAQKK